MIVCEVEARVLEGMRKLAIARVIRGDQASEVFTLVSDEGAPLGGEGSAPTPLMYFVAGVAF
ncbi:hypothetical protein HRbin22_01172 [Candidatus Thermoflexus japonica]|uniref:Uncharacterized protein n=1 Tax=Candidatus Thermoflexus japonica TaxID=2035417 RepID=A0A2H5Y658_9CHLR|nr:hypothetical protein HRbin22_01172 [Candidatus Thermoflexus japonica]